MRHDHFINNVYFSLRRLKTAFLKKVSSPTGHKYLFILSGAACGSTLLHEIVSDSKNVSAANNRWAREGIYLPLVRDFISYNFDYSWKHQVEYNWQELHKALLKYWDPRKKIFLDKTPVYLFQANSIAKEFKDVHFICLHRNPYSQIESYMRKGSMDKDSCIAYALDSLLQLRTYLETFDFTFSLSYTYLTEKPALAVKDLCEWLPELGNLSLKEKYSAHNVLEEKKLEIRNLDAQKIDNLSDDDIRLINRSLKEHKDLLAYFGYEYIYR